MQLNIIRSNHKEILRHFFQKNWQFHNDDDSEGRPVQVYYILRVTNNPHHYLSHLDHETKPN